MKNYTYIRKRRVVWLCRRPVHRFLITTVALFVFATVTRCQAFDVDKHERDSGGTLAALINPRDDIYGAQLMFQRWIIGTPIYGDYFMSFLSNNLEDASYAAFGLMVRLMPQMVFAPFIAAGGSYNTALSDNSDASSGEISVAAPGVSARVRTRAPRYWAGHAECGFRITPYVRGLFFEAALQYNWTSGSVDNYPLVRIGIGRSF